MTIVTALRQFFDTPAGTGVVLLFALAVLDFLLGTFAAFRDGTFQLDSLGAWIRKHVAGRVLPITAVLVIGHLLGGLALDGAAQALSPGTVLTTIGLGAAGVYVLEVIGSVKESLTPKPSPVTTVRDSLGSFRSSPAAGPTRKVPQD